MNVQLLKYPALNQVGCNFKHADDWAVKLNQWLRMNPSVIAKKAHEDRDIFISPPKTYKEINQRICSALKV